LFLLPSHNLRDFFSGRSSTSAYGTSFLSAISSLVTLPPTERIETASKTLLSHPSYKQAHPTIEHLLPLFVAIGAGGKEGKGTVEVEDDDGALGWGFYRFD
jgi:4,5-DOPA dioxygenase extradiol